MFGASIGGVAMPDWVAEILKEFPTLAVCLLVVYIAGKWMTAAYQAHLKSKDAEIDRLVDEKNRLQELLLTERLSTSGKSNKKKK